MAWNGARTWVNGDVVGAQDLNEQLRDNLLALKDPPGSQIAWDNGAAYSTTSTSFVPVDTTNLKITLETKGGDVMVGFTGCVHADSTTSRFVAFDIRVDGTTNWWDSRGYASGVFGTAIQSTIGQGVSFGPVWIEGLAPGVHTFELAWKAYAGTIYLHSDTADTDWRNEQPIIFWAKEMG